MGNADLPLLWQEIQESFGTTQAAVVWVGGDMCMCKYAHVCSEDGGRQAGKHLLGTPGPAQSVNV